MYVPAGHPRLLEALSRSEAAERCIVPCRLGADPGSCARGPRKALERARAGRARSPQVESHQHPGKAVEHRVGLGRLRESRSLE